jgi:hypothetical protein
MTIDKLTVFSRLDGSGPSEAVDLARRFLMEKNISGLSERSHSVKVSETLRLWQTRLRNTEITKRAIPGAELLIKQLQTLNPDADLEQFSFMSPRKVGSIFFDRASSAFVGLVVVDRPGRTPPPEQRETASAPGAHAPRPRRRRRAAP